MILIADSGGSKIDWRILHEDGKIDQTSGPGFNPYYQNPSHLTATINENLIPLVSGRVKKIFFYGSGVSSPKNQEIVKKVLNNFFDGAEIDINHDLLGAARSLCGEEPGIACILGTGSNSCFFEDGVVKKNITNLGWILGDEGGGVYMGKKLLVDYLRNQVPKKLGDQFQARFSVSRDDVLDKVYRQEKPSAFLSSFSKFIFQHIKEPYCYQLVYTSLNDFFTQNVMRYDNYKNYKVHFTGSVAFYFSDILRQVANDLGVTVKNIVETPIAGLTLYHKKDLN